MEKLEISKRVTTEGSSKEFFILFTFSGYWPELPRCQNKSMKNITIGFGATHYFLFKFTKNLIRYQIHMLQMLQICVKYA